MGYDVEDMKAGAWDNAADVLCRKGIRYTTYTKDLSLGFDVPGGSINIFRNGMTMTVSGVDYQGFDRLLEALEPFFEAVSVLGVSEIKPLTIMKTNRFLLRNTGLDDEAKQNVVKQLLSPAIIAEMAGGRKLAKMEKEKLELAGWEYSFDNKLDSTVFELRILLSRLAGVSPQDARQVFADINDDLYSYWHWAMSENVFDMMSK